MRKNNKNPTKVTEISYDSIINHIKEEDFSTILDIKCRFHSVQEWDYILTRNNNHVRHLLIENYVCPWCMTKLDFVSEGEFQFQATGYLQCPYEHDLY